jgi:hypothetical protein
MQSVDFPLLDTGPSDAMSSLNTAVIKIDKTFIGESSLNKSTGAIRDFHLDFVLQLILFLTQQYYSKYSLATPHLLKVICF